MVSNQAPFDRYSSAHFGFGTVAQRAGAPWWLTLGISIGFETIEDYLKDAFRGAFPYSSHDSGINSIGDHASVMAGWAAARLAHTPTQQLAIDAAVRATLVGFAGAAVAAAVAVATDRDVSDGSAVWGDRGFRIGSAVGAATTKSPVAGALGGLVLGPAGTLGAVLLAEKLRNLR